MPSSRSRTPTLVDADEASRRRLTARVCGGPILRCESGRRWRASDDDPISALSELASCVTSAGVFDTGDGISGPETTCTERALEASHA
jgi:hypothetical protein